MSPKNKVNKPDKLRLVLIKWRDAWGSDYTKGDLEYMRDQAKDEWIVMSVGFVIEENDDSISFSREWICATKGHSDKFEALQKIPKSMIIEIKELKQFECKAMNA